MNRTAQRALTHRLSTLFFTGLFVASCGPRVETPPAGSAGAKGDNYISTNAREYNLTGAVQVALPEPYAALDSEELAEIADGELNTIARAVKRHVQAVIDDSNGEITGEDANWFTYLKPGSARVAAVRAGADTNATVASVAFDIELVGSYYLMSKLAPEPRGSRRTHRTFDVTITRWNETEGQRVTVEVTGSPSRDAFPKYNEMFADGVYDIAVHFGGDYNEGRHDLETARWLVDEMLGADSGWTAPAGVASFDDLTVASGPFTRQITVRERSGGDKSVRVEVHVYHSDMVTEDEEAKLSEAMKQSFASRDVVIYTGHAGAGAGFILDYQPRHEIKARDFATMPMADKYQIFVLDGCRTYRTYVDDLMQNPAKTFDNVDIMTTVNTTPFSVGYQVLWEYLYWLTITDGAGRHYPQSWKTILRGINTRDFRSVHYGVHGIDSDPGLNPHGSDGVAGRACIDDSACGAGGNLCLGDGVNPGFCGVACAHDTACPSGFRCARLTDISDQFYIPKQCIPRR